MASQRSGKEGNWPELSFCPSDMFKQMFPSNDGNISIDIQPSCQALNFPIACGLCGALGVHKITVRNYSGPGRKKFELNNLFLFFQSQQLLFSFGTPTVSPNPTSFGNYPVARYNQGNWIGRAGTGNCSGCLWLTDGGCYFTVVHCSSCGNCSKMVPYFALKCGSFDIKG